MNKKSNAKPKEKREEATIKEYELISKALWQGSLPIRYGENEVEIFSRDQKKSIVLPIPKEYISSIKQLLDQTEPVDNKEFHKVAGYILRIIDVMGKMDLEDSTPRERELKIAAAKQCLQDKRQKKE